MYYVDVYTRNSVCHYESYSKDSILFIVSTYVVMAQTISVYSYIEDQQPYQYGPYATIIKKALVQASLVPLAVPSRVPRLPRPRRSFRRHRQSRQYCRN